MRLAAMVGLVVEEMRQRRRQRLLDGLRVDHGAIADDAVEVVGVEDVVAVDGGSDKPAGLGGRQPAEHLDELVHLSIGELHCDFGHAAIGGHTEGILDDLLHLLFIGPADVEGNRQASRVRTERAGVDEDQGPEAGIGGKIQIAEKAGDLGVGAERRNIFEQIDDGVGRVAYVA